MINYDDQDNFSFEGYEYDKFQVLYLIKVEEIMQLVRNRNLPFDAGFDQLWQLLSNDN